MKRFGNIKNTDIYKASLVLQIVALYLLATGRTGWYLYVILILIFAERAFIAIALWVMSKVQQQAAQQLMEILAKNMKAGDTGLTRLPPPFNGEDE